MDQASSSIVAVAPFGATRDATAVGRPDAAAATLGVTPGLRVDARGVADVTVALDPHAATRISERERSQPRTEINFPADRTQSQESRHRHEELAGGKCAPKLATPHDAPDAEAHSFGQRVRDRPKNFRRSCPRRPCAPIRPRARASAAAERLPASARATCAPSRVDELGWHVGVS